MWGGVKTVRRNRRSGIRTTGPNNSSQVWDKKENTTEKGNDRRGRRPQVGSMRGSAGVGERGKEGLIGETSKFPSCRSSVLGSA